ncbi:hypothetical protein VTI74DRAFT_8669 [Chaetomium olivicolor]
MSQVNSTAKVRHRGLPGKKWGTRSRMRQLPACLGRQVDGQGRVSGIDRFWVISLSLPSSALRLVKEWPAVETLGWKARIVCKVGAAGLGIRLPCGVGTLTLTAGVRWVGFTLIRPTFRALGPAGCPGFVLILLSCPEHDRKTGCVAMSCSEIGCYRGRTTDGDGLLGDRDRRPGWSVKQSLDVLAPRHHVLGHHGCEERTERMSSASGLKFPNGDNFVCKAGSVVRAPNAQQTASCAVSGQCLARRPGGEGRGRVLAATLPLTP